MSAPLDHRPPRANEDSPTRLRRARAAVRYGAVILASSLVLLFLLAVLSLGPLTKYVATVGLLGACLGLGVLLNGAVDWWRA